MKKNIEVYTEAKRLGIQDQMLVSWSEKEKEAFVRKHLKKEARRQRMRVKRRKGYA